MSKPAMTECRLAVCRVAVSVHNAGARTKRLRLDLVLAHQRKKSAPVLFCCACRMRHIAAVASKQMLDIAALELLHHACLGGAKGVLGRRNSWGGRQTVKIDVLCRQ